PHRLKRAALHGQQDLEGLGAHLATDELGPAVAVRVLVGTAVVDLGDVARGPGQEDHDAVLAVIALDRLLQVVDIIGRDAAGASRGVAGEVDDAAQQTVGVLGVPGPDHADLRVHGSGWLHDVRVAQAGV